MRELSEQVLQICLFSVFIGMVSLLLPESGVAVRAKVMFGILFIVIIIRGFSGWTPLKAVKNNSNISVSQELNNTVAAQSIKYSQEALEGQIEEFLAGKEITAQLKVNMDISEDNVISISSVTVFCKTWEEAGKAVEAVYNNYGLRAETAVIKANETE